MVILMEGCKLSGLLIIVLLAIGGVAVFPQASAQPNEAGASLQVVDEGNYKKITTDDLTIVFPRNGTKPFFVWWANSDPSKAYVVHFKGLIEYAEINGSSFSLMNVSEGTLWQRMIQAANAFDLARAGAAAKGLSVAFEAHSRLMLAAGKAMLFRADLGQVKALLQNAGNELSAMGAEVNDSEISQQIDATVDAIDSAISAIDSGANKGTVQNAISAAIRECQRLTQTITERAREMIGDMVEKRQNLISMAESFHPALLAFSGCRWEMGDVRPITASDGTIGIAFNLTLADAPQKFDFAEGNVNLSVRIYNSTVIETVSAAGEDYSYSIAAGEIKIDLVVKDWDWNFDPRTISLLNTTSITITPALALWVDASSFYVNGSVSSLFDDLDDVKAQAASGNIVFSADDANATLNLQRQDQDANGLGLHLKVAQKSIAGRLMKFPAPAKLRLTEEGTLGGFFKFVPTAIVTNETGEESTVNVTAAYLSAGNHVKMYLCYPYFNGTLTHDPSLGVEKAADSAAYVVTLSADSGIVSIQEIPTTPAWGRSNELFLASGLVLVAAIGLILLFRRHPAAV
ncbi:MAG: hypothetical protein ABC612_03365 [Candidatus Methanosuratincola petrocarbonis]|nr:hypothetical protein [Candidatus Methanosuratincola sp.]